MTTDQVLALELRVLTGLQAGAALPLQEPLLVGSGEDADLLLLDDGIAEAQSRVARGPGAEVLIDVLADGVVLQDGRRPASGESFTLEPGQAFQMGPAWLVVKSEDAPWEPWTQPSPQAHPPDSTPSGDDATIERGASAPADEAVPATGGAEAPLKNMRGKGAATRKQAARRKRPNVPGRQIRMVGSLIVAAGLLSTMLGVAALVRQASGTDRPDGTVPAAVIGPPASASASASDPGPASAPAFASAPASGSASEPVRTADLTPSMPPSSPSEIGHESRQKRLLVQIPGEEDIVLPFDIAEVLMGLSSHVILSDGRRLYPGDQVGPWRLVAIRRGVLVFDGPRKVQVAW